MNVSTLRSILGTKFAATSSSIELPVKQDEFQAFKSNLEINLDPVWTNNPFLTAIIGNFNVKSSNWYLNDIYNCLTAISCTLCNRPVKSTQIHKQLGMRYEVHIKSILNKVNKTIGLLNKFLLILPRHSLTTIYKTFIRPHLDYGDIIFNHPFNESFQQRH